MKILFLCGSLEPGSDGVGDYTRRLAASLIRQNHSAAIIALNDWKIELAKDENQYSDGTEVQVLRLPSLWSLKKRFAVAFKWVNVFNPEWITLQYVPFSFNPKGLPVGLSSYLKQFSPGRKWNIMFHELWLVSKSSVAAKRVLTGSLQKILIEQLIKKLKPAVIHTQSQFSQYHLLKLGFQAKVLPLFSNIPSVVKHVGFAEANESNKTLNIVSFGSVYPNALIKQFAKEAADFQKKAGVQIVLILAGRSGIHRQHWIDVWKGEGMKVEVMGELSADKISTILAASTAGISSTPFIMSEKSGAVAAMREHGLPVICIADPWIPKGFDFQPPDGIINYSNAGFEACLSYKPTFPHGNNVSVVAKQLATDLLAGH